MKIQELIDLKEKGLNIKVDLDENCFFIYKEKDGKQKQIDGGTGKHWLPLLVDVLNHLGFIVNAPEKTVELELEDVGD